MPLTLESSDRGIQADPPGRGRLLSAATAGLLAVGVFVTAGVIRGSYPFGARSRNINDLGQQFIPMHAYYRDVLTGQAHGNLLFNWSSGFGVQFLGDFMAYVGTPLSWVVVLFPRDRIDLALFVIACAHLFLAGALMTWYLRLLRPLGPAWLAVIAGFSYATCSWALDDGIYMTDWLSGLTAFPLFLLLCEWVLRRPSARSMVISPLLVGVAWTSHFYTVYMATIGAGLVLLARLLTHESLDWRARVAGLVRCATVVGLGIGLAAPLLLPTKDAVAAATPSPVTPLIELPWRDFLSRLLAGTQGVGFSPSFAVGTVMLVLALTLPFNRRIPVWNRLVWTVLLVATVESMRVYVTYFAWHGFDSPNGSQYRQAFVIAGMLVVAGWLSASAGVRWFAAVAAAVPVAVLLAVAHGGRFVTASTRVGVPALLVVTVVALVALSRASGNGTVRARASGVRTLATAAAALLMVGALAEGVASAVAIDKDRSRFLSASATWSDARTQVVDLISGADDWPRSRVDPGITFTANDPMLVGGEGSSYYTSTIPAVLSTTLQQMGWGYSSYGRANRAPDSPVTQAIFAVGATVVPNPTTGAQPAYVLQRSTPAPLVTLRRTAFRSTDPVPYGPQEDAIGADLYTVPAITLKPSEGTSMTARSTGEWALRGPAGVEATATLTASCPAGNTAWFWAPRLVAEYQAGGTWVGALSPHATRPGIYTGLEMRALGPVGADGTVTVPLRWTGQALVPGHAVGCLDTSKLAAQLAALRSSAPTDVTVGSTSVTVRLPAGATGNLVIASARVPGWVCGPTNGTRRTPGTVAGLIATPVDGVTGSVTCSFRPQGLRPGLGVGGVALLGLALVGGWFVHRRRAAARSSEAVSAPLP